MILLAGLLFVFHPSVLYKRELLTKQQVERNNRIFRRGGIVLIILSLVILSVNLF
jgi:CHASE3 domain sensor protein